MGGARRKIFDPALLEPVAAPTSAAELLQLVLRTIVDVRAARIDPKRASTMFYGASVANALLETVDLAARLEVLEERYAAQDAALQEDRVN